VNVVIPEESLAVMVIDSCDCCCYRHSLFPLLALLFERCEQATHAPDTAALSSLKADIQLFVQHQQRDGGKFSCDDPEVDSLVSMLVVLCILSICSSICSSSSQCV